MGTDSVKAVSPYWLDLQLVLSKNPPPSFKRRGKSPFVKGDLERLSSAQHHFDEILSFGILALTGKRLSR
jgi:hypothetical protein